MSSVYGTLATEVYDLDKPIGHSFGDVELYQERLRACPGLLLEPASGTGRILIPLLEAGLPVHGLESSPAMLACCQNHLTQRSLRTELFSGYMQELSLPHRYAAIVLPAGSFLLLEDAPAAHAALRGFHQHLEAGGLLMMDMYLPETGSVGKTSIQQWTSPGGDILTMEDTLVEIDFLRQRTLSYLRYEKWREGKLIATELQRFSLRWYGVEEFTRLLTAHGFDDIEISADYKKGQPPVHGGQTLTFSARKL